MKAHYGYEDGSGRYYITIDTDKCTGCEECVKVCPAAVLLMVEEDPLEQKLVAAVVESQRNKLKYSCGPCNRLCVKACEPNAIEWE